MIASITANKEQDKKDRQGWGGGGGAESDRQTPHFQCISGHATSLLKSNPKWSP